MKKIKQEHIDQIRKQFAELQTKENLVELLSNARNMLYGEECKPVQLKSLTYYANPTLCKKRYKTFTIKKKSGADRTIHAPVGGLKSILRSLNFVLQCIYEPHEAATGFVIEKSIVDNARKHVGQHYVLNMDLKDFFHTFDRNRVKMGFIQKPFNLNGDREPLAFLLASLCTHPFEVDGEIKTVLPQGSPTSPTITNILCKQLDRRLAGLAKRFGATYTRYADDITFSSLHNINTDEEFNKELMRIIEEDQQLVINTKKTRLQKSGYRQEATGLIVNEKVNVHRRYVKQIRMWLHYWEKYGYEKAEQIFKRDYIADKGHVKNIDAHLVNVLDGKLEFLKMVKGVEDGTYKGLKNRFNNLSNPINQILDIWENERIERTIENYDDSKNKYDFIIKLLETQKMDSSQKEHFLKNVVNELNKDFSDKEEIEKRLREIEENLKEKEQPIMKNIKEKTTSPEPNPKHVADFMSLFNQRDGLKYLTHGFDEGYFDVENYLNSAEETFKRTTKEINIPQSLWQIVNQFAFENKQISWTSISQSYNNQIHVKKGWGTKELQDWSKSNKLHPILNEEYQEIINNFRRITRIEKSNLQELINAILKNNFDDFFIETKDLDKADFYTHVGNLKNALEAVFEEIEKHSDVFEKKKILIKYDRSTSDDGYFVRRLIITHFNSFPTKELILLVKEWQEKGNMGKIKANLRGYCHWSVETIIENTPTRINILKDKNTSEYDFIDNIPCYGFTHIFTFYYK